MVSYSRRAVKRAYKDTVSFLGHDWKKKAIGWTVTILALGFWGLFEGTKSTVARVEWWLAGIVAGLVLAIVTFLINLLAAPARMEKDQEKKFSDREKSIQDLHEKAMADARQQFRDSLDELRSLIQKKDELLLTRTTRADIARQLAEFHKQGSLLKAQIIDSDDSSLPVAWSARVQLWGNTVGQYIHDAISPQQGHLFAIGPHLDAKRTYPEMKSQETRQEKYKLLLNLDAFMDRVSKIIASIDQLVHPDV
jgi:hypothetical protein